MRPNKIHTCPNRDRDDGDRQDRGESEGRGPTVHRSGSLQSLATGDKAAAPVESSPGEGDNLDQWGMHLVSQRNARGAQREGLDQWEAPDRGWGWVVLAATILVLALTLAFPSSIGIFYKDLQTEFNTSNSGTAWVPSLMTAVLHAGGPFCSVLVEHYGCRATVMLGGILSGLGMVASSFTRTTAELYITAGIITGLGFCFSYQPAVTILGHYFIRRRAFANAMSSTGTAIGLSTLPFLARFLRSHLGWRGSFLVLGGVLLNSCVCGAVMRPVGRPQACRGQLCPTPPLRTRLAITGLLASLHKHMAFDLFCSNLQYRMYTLAITWMMLGFMVPLVYLVPYATNNGMEPDRAALLLAVLGFVNILARPLVGLLFNLPWFQGRHVYVFATALLVNGLSNNICCIAASFPVLLGYMMAYGLSMSVVGSLLFTVLMGIVDMSRFPAALGLLSTMESVTMLVGPPLAGILVDTTKQYTHVFYACSGVVASAALFLMVSFYWLDREVIETKCLSLTMKPQTESDFSLSDGEPNSVQAQKGENPFADASNIAIV